MLCGERLPQQEESFRRIDPVCYRLPRYLSSSTIAPHFWRLFTYFTRTKEQVISSLRKKKPKHLAEARHDRRKSYTVHMMSSSTFQSSNKIPKQEIANYHWDQFYYSKGCFSTTEHCGLPRCDVLRWGEEHLYGQKRCLLWSSSDPGFQKQGGFM